RRLRSGSGCRPVASGALFPYRARSVPVQPVGQCLDPGGDVPADQAHALDPVDAAVRGLIGVPAFEPRTGDRIDVRLPAEEDDHVDLAHELWIDGGGDL